jgi:pilus assembly protein CpaC
MRVGWLGAIAMLAALLSNGAAAQDLFAPSSLLSGGNQLVVPLFKSRVLRLDAPATRVSIGNPDIADILILRSTQLYVLGKDLGTTNVLVWDSEDRLIGAVNIEVGHDLDHLKQKLFELLPSEQVEVYSAQRSIVLAGQISSITAMNAALRIADNYLAQVATAVDASQFQQEGQSARPDRAVGQIINLMQVGGVQQVMLEVKVAEINRSELRRMNAQFNGMNIGGSGWSYGGVNGGARFPDVEFTAPVNGRLPVFDQVAPWGPAIDEFAPVDMSIRNQGLFASFLSQDSMFNLALDIAKENRLAKILAEPTLTTLTGEQATFLSGGEVAIPVPQSDFRTTFEFKEFGVAVSFLPVVLQSGLINLKVDITVSEITRLEPGSLIPLQLGTRKATATVELREGQTMGLAGLINENMREAVEKFPGLGSIPILGALFRSQDFINQETELVITVTPRLAKPMRPEDIRLPTDNFVEPNDAEFFLMGRLEGRASRRPRTSGGAGTGASAAAGGVEGTFGHQLD